MLFKRFLFFTCVFSFGVCSLHAEPIAGEITQNESTTPFVALEPAHDITNILPQTSTNEETEPDIHFSADILTANEKEQTIEASGDVVVTRETLTLYTDHLIYNQKTNQITAVGHVLLTEPDGMEISADEINLNDKLTTAEMNKIKVIMRDESKLWASHFRKKENDTKIMRDALFTPCDFCEGEHKTAPLWRIRARKVTHNAETKNMNYNDAFLDIKNVPVLYLPFLSHPDPTVKRRSGFMPPKIIHSSYIGSAAQINYFWNISPYTDVLFSPTFTTNKGVVWGGRYRGYSQKGYLEFEGTYLNDDNKDRDRNRGNIFAKGRYELSDTWLASTDINYASDSLYLKELSLDQDDKAWLTSKLAFERFQGRQYTDIEAYYYKLVSYDLKMTDHAEYQRLNNSKPFTLPLIEAEFISDPNNIGLYFKNNFSYASLYHSGDMQSHRATMINSVNLPWTSQFGERYRIVGSLKTDIYNIKNYQFSSSKKDFDGTPVRVFPQIGLEWKLPFIKSSEDTRQIIEPVIVGVLSPNDGNKSSKIPNEDSQNADLEDTNILDIDRYAGYDQNDNGSRISYGFNFSNYGKLFGRTSAFLAQSYQFNDRTSFSKATEDDGHLSDYVGRIYAKPADYLDLTYRFRLDREDFKFNYNELASRLGTNMLNLYASYIYLQKNNYYSKSLNERQELYLSLHAGLTRDWSIDIYNRQDLEGGGHSLEHGGHLIYEDECFTFITNVKKYNSNDPDLDDSYEVTFTFYLKTLGGMGK